MEQIVRDHTGRVIFMTKNNGGQTESVYDGRGAFLGSTSSLGTFDARGVRITAAEAPGLLKRP